MICPNQPLDLRRVETIGIGRRSFQVIHLPARKMRAADIPFFALAVRLRMNAPLRVPTRTRTLLIPRPLRLKRPQSFLDDYPHCSLSASRQPFHPTTCSPESRIPSGAPLHPPTPRIGEPLQICAPDLNVSLREEKHQMRMPMAAVIAYVPLFWTTCSPSRPLPSIGQFLLVEQHALMFSAICALDCPANAHSVFFNNEWKIGSRGRCVKAYGSTQLGIPELGIFGSSRP